MAIVLLVLQLSAAGGTFPIQVVPAFFQAINPFLPFTYAISMMREVVGGMLADIVRKKTLRCFFAFGLACCSLAFFFISLLVKRVQN